MTYAELLARLLPARRFGVKLGLERMHAALAAVGHPERRVGAVITVGGTNGKGSTAAFLEAALVAAGRRTGLYTSPHLCRLSERFRVAGRELDGDTLAARYSAIVPVIGELTFFEQTTVLALCAFADAGVDVAILEIGLGGRFDAVNAVTPQVAVVTGVALDHQAILGDSLAAIAFEKAGIFRAGTPAVIGQSGEPAAVALLEAHARAAGSEVVLAPDAPPPSWGLGLGGAHQARNAACALAALDALEHSSAGAVRVPPDVRRRALAAARWPGRLERMPGEPRVWLDGAHNPHGAAALAAAIAAERPSRLCVVVGVSSDKDVAGLLAPIVGQAELVVCTAAPNERALAPAALATAVAALAGMPSRTVLVEPDLTRALAAARARAGRGSDLVVVYGSLFLVGAMRALITGEPVDPLIAQDPAVGQRP